MSSPIQAPVPWLQRTKQRVAKLLRPTLIIVLATLVYVLPAWVFNNDFPPQARHLIRGLLPRIVYINLDYFFGLVSATVAVLLGFYLYRTFAKRPDAVSQQMVDEATIRDSVHVILNSDKFLTTLREALPSGQDDAKFGFDYIPYLLHALDERRRRLEKSTRRFLSLTIALGLVFGFILAGIGFILVDDTATGPYRRLADLQKSVEGLRDDYATLQGQVGHNPIYLKSVLPSITALKQSATNNVSDQELIQAIKAVEDKGDLQAAKAAIDQMLSDGKNHNEQFRQKAVDAQYALNSFLTSQTEVQYTLPDHLKSFDALLADTRKALESSSYQTSATLKRLGVGFVVASFFLAILRYVSRLYRDFHTQLVGTENETLAIRKFYVTYKCASASVTTQNAILTKFLEVGPSTVGVEMEKDTGEREHDDLVKELLKILAKRT